MAENINDRPRGHDAITKQLAELSDAVSAGKDAALHHAYVFAGPDGIGKFTTALWWARRLKCEGDATCDASCPSCRQITIGTHPDVITLAPEKPGKKIGIDRVREVIRLMSLRSQRRGPRVTLIRDAHLLTFESQNAMLKLLEEPLGHAVLILVAPSPGSLLATVRSRCQVLRFNRLEDADVNAILQATGISAEDAALRAAAAAGSVTAAMLLDEDALASRAELVAAWETICDDPHADVERLAGKLAEKDEHRDERLWGLMAWQLKKARAALGGNDSDPAPGASAVLDRLRNNVGRNDVARMVADAERVNATLRMLESSVNAKVAIRDLLLDLRG